MSDADIATILEQLRSINTEVEGLRKWRHDLDQTITRHDLQIHINTTRLDKIIEDHNDQMAKGGCQQINVSSLPPEVPISNVQAVLKFMSSMGGAGIIIMLLTIIALVVLYRMGLTFKS